MPTKKGGPSYQLVALTQEQLKNLHALHHARYKGDEAITCNSCLQAQEANINGEADELAIATKGHDKSPTTCLQAFWRAMFQAQMVNKNGNFGRKAMKLTVGDIRAAEQAQ